ncbi:MAG: N-acetylmuramoyl-L-alanine amidase [Actinomycetota bacterium]|nr:N-acetylmuramoyl-L-alanine amidase [Actinomycetota bacterium]
MAALVMVVSAVVFSEPAVALTAPETLADRRPVRAGPVEPGFPIDYVGVLWASPVGHDHGDDDREGDAHGAVRFRHDGVWGPWVPLIEDGAAGPGDDQQWASGLVAGDDAEAFQVRGLPAAAARPQAVAINTTDGPPVRIGEAKGGTASALASANCRSRADWGADESLRFGADGTEVWPPAHYPVQVATVHHTATKNDDSDPEATVRAIYRYHAVDNGWGDIGYHYLIDESGVVYEGRWSGSKSASCEMEGGDASDFAHETTDLDGDGVLDEMTTAAHTGGANSGNVGLALLGEFTDHPRTGGDPKAAAVTALEDVLSELGQRHGLDPTGEVAYVNPVNGDQRLVDTISGHRDWTATECPGDNLFGQLPTIRTNVAAKMAAPGTGGSLTVHVGDLDGSAATAKNQWYANVAVTVVDEAGIPVADADVDGTWTTLASAATCTTDASGTCTVTSERVRKSTDALTLRVDAVTHATLGYDAGANSDPDGDSDGTTITVNKPA